MKQLLDNPVYNALITGDTAFALGTQDVKYFDDAVSPFAGFNEEYGKGFNELHDILPQGRKILYATRKQIKEAPGWKQLVEIQGLQFLFDKGSCNEKLKLEPVALQQKDVEQMMELAALTKPGPFGSRTIEFGHYHGIFEDQQLVAMTGQRLHVDGYTEISAVCTHPDHLGKGYAATLLQHQLKIIKDHGQIPFLHVREDNKGAIALYERLGFIMYGSMNFYFMKRV